MGRVISFAYQKTCKLCSPWYVYTSRLLYHTTEVMLFTYIQAYGCLHELQPCNNFAFLTFGISGVAVRAAPRLVCLVQANVRPTLTSNSQAKGLGNEVKKKIVWEQFTNGVDPSLSLSIFGYTSTTTRLACFQPCKLLPGCNCNLPGIKSTLGLCLDLRQVMDTNRKHSFLSWPNL